MKAWKLRTPFRTFTLCMHWWHLASIVQSFYQLYYTNNVNSLSSKSFFTVGLETGFSFFFLIHCVPVCCFWCWFIRSSCNFTNTRLSGKDLYSAGKKVVFDEANFFPISWVILHLGRNCIQCVEFAAHISIDFFDSWMTTVSLIGLTVVVLCFQWLTTTIGHRSLFASELRSI